MIVDCSAVVAILASGPERYLFLKALAEAPGRYISGASLLETSIVLNRIFGPKTGDLLEEFLLMAAIEVVPFSLLQARLAFQAYQRYDKG